MKKIFFKIIISINIFIFISCSEEKPSTQSNQKNAALNPAEFYFVFPKSTKEYKSFIDVYGSQIKKSVDTIYGHQFKKSVFINNYGLDNFEYKNKSNVFTNLNGVKENIFFDEGFPSWLVYDSSTYGDFLIVVIGHYQIAEALNLKDKKNNIEFYLKIGYLIDTINLLNASIFNDYDYYIKFEGIKIKGRKLIDLTYNTINYDEAYKYLWDNFKIPPPLYVVATYRNPNYYVVDEKEDININGN